MAALFILTHFQFDYMWETKLSGYRKHSVLCQYLL